VRQPQPRACGRRRRGPDSFNLAAGPPWRQGRPSGTRTEPSRPIGESRGSSSLPLGRPDHDFLIYTCGRLHSNHSESEDQNPDETRRRYTPVGDIQSGFPGAGGKSGLEERETMATENNASHDMTTRPLTTLDNQTHHFFFFLRWPFLRILDAAQQFPVVPSAFPRYPGTRMVSWAIYWISFQALSCKGETWFLTNHSGGLFSCSFLHFCPFVQEEHFGAWAVQNQLERDWGGVASSPFSLRGQANTRRYPRTTWRQLLHNHDWRLWSPFPWTFIFFLDSDRGPPLISHPLGLAGFTPGVSFYDFSPIFLFAEPPWASATSLHSDSGSGGKRLLFLFLLCVRRGCFGDEGAHSFIPLWEEGQTKGRVARVEGVEVLRGSTLTVVGSCSR
jgi:hypothetical protein